MPSSTRESASAPTKRSAVKHKYRVANNHVHMVQVVFTLLFSHLKVQEIMIRQVCGARLAFFAMRQSLECRGTWRVQCSDMHVHGYAILKLLPRRNHAQSLYCDGENEQCGKRERF